MKEERNIKNYSTKELRKICHEPMALLRKDDNKIGLFITHKFSIYFIRLFLHTKFTPNQITVLSVVVFFVGILFLALADYWMGVIGSLIIFLSLILDACDGGVARFRKQTSRMGGVYTEPISHDVQYGFAFLLISIGLVMHGSPPYYYILGALAGLMKLSTRLLQTRFCDLLRPKEVDDKAEGMQKELKEKSVFVKVAYRINKTLFNNSGVFVVISVCALVNRVDLCLWFFAIGSSLIWLAMFGKQMYQIRKHHLNKIQ